MSSLKNLRQRLNKFEHEHFNKDSKDEENDDRSSLSSADAGEAMDRTERLLSENSPHNEELKPSTNWHNSDDRKAFEDQLNQLQEHLMIVMIENQNLKSELKSSKNILELEKVKILLEYERKRNEILEKKCQEETKKKIQSHTGDKGVPAVIGANQERSISSTSAINGDDIGEFPQGSPLTVTQPVGKRFSEILVDRLSHFVHTFFEDFSDEPVSKNAVEPDGDPLSVETLKENIRRFGSEITPYENTAKGIFSMLAWKSPPHTLIVFVVYMYSVWQGWFLPVLLFCFNFRLFINFLRHRGWNISFNFFEVPEEPKDEEDKDDSIADKITLVMHVARKVQNLLGGVDDKLEKVKSLLTWRHPEASQRLFLILTLALIISCFVPTTALFLYAGLGLGIQLFIVDYMYSRFPRIRRKYDTHGRLWNELPTDADCKNGSIKPELNKGILHDIHEKGDVNADTKSGQGSMDDRTFCELFSLPESEFPLPDWQGGRRCTLIRKDKSFTAAFKNGRLFLTSSFLCFERTKLPSPKNITIPLADIIRIDKVKPFGWMPSGMSIEISVVGNEKPYIFGAMINRDEILEGIVKAGRKAGLSWSTASSLID